jgi:F420-0:gamma-glutamyl ligase
MSVGTRVEYIALRGIPRVEPGDDLAVLIRRALVGMEIELQRGDILVLAQKIVSKSEGRYVSLRDVLPSTGYQHSQHVITPLASVAKTGKQMSRTGEQCF